MSIININLDDVQETLVSGVNIKTINGESVLGTGNITIQGCSFGTDGQIPFMNGSDDDFSYSSNLFWDSANSRLGIGTTSPSTTLHVSGGVSGAIGTRVAQFEGNLPELLLMDTSDSKGFSFSKYGNNLYFVNTNSSGAYSSYAGLIQLNSGKWSIGHGSNPSAQLHVKSGGSTSASTNFLLQNSSGTDLFKVEDGGNVGIGTTSPTALVHLAQAADSNGIQVDGYDDWSGANAKIYVDNFGRTFFYGSTTTKLSSGGSVLLEAGGYMNASPASGFRVNTTYMSVGVLGDMGAQLGVRGDGSTSATTNFLLQDSSSTDLFKVTDDGQVNISSLPTSATGLASGDIWNDSGTLKIV